MQRPLRSGQAAHWQASCQWRPARPAEPAERVMKMVVELIADPEQGGYTARVPDIPAHGEGQTEEETVADLKEALRGYIEAVGPDDALSRISQPTLREAEWDRAELSRG